MGRAGAMALFHDDRLFPADPTQRAIARRLYAEVRGLPIVSPHGHTQAAWFAGNQPFPDPAKLFVQPDHYVYRMLYSQGISLDDLEIGVEHLKDPRRVWRIFAENYYLLRGTPTRLWLDYAFHELFGLEERLSAATADLYFDTISERLLTPEFRPRALYERFQIEVLATTDSPLDSLADHRAIRDSGWKPRGVAARILPTFRPDPVVDPDFAGFEKNVAHGWASLRSKTAATGTAICELWRRHAAAFRRSVVQQRITAIRRRKRRICHASRRCSFSAPCSRGAPTRSRKSCSARRC